MQQIPEDQAEAIAKIKETCHRIAHEMMTLQPAITKLSDEKLRAGLFETVYQLTANVESVKKLVIRHEKGDASKIL